MTSAPPFAGRTFDPGLEVQKLRDHLASHDKPIAFLLGAGTSAAVIATDGTPLIPAVAELRSPRRAEPGQWLLKGLVRCGVCGVGTNCHKMRGRNGTWHRYYYCRNHDPLRAGGQDRRCPERNIRSDALDTFVFDQVRAALLRPDTLLAGEQAVASNTPTPDDELLAVELTHLDRKLTAADEERRRLADLYQAGLVALPELQQRAADVEHRRRDNLTAQRRELTRDNQLRHRVAGFAQRVLTVIDHLDFEQKQTLLRLVVDEVRVTGWNVEIQLRIPLDDPGRPPPHPPEPSTDDQPPLSSEDRLRSLGGNQRNAKLLLTAVLGPFDRVDGLYLHAGLYPRPRRTGGGRPDA